MSIEKLLDHKCDIRHLRKTIESAGFGIMNVSGEAYPKEPDISSIPCHFHVNGTATIAYSGARPDLTSEIKLDLPIGTDVRINDHIYWLEAGLEFTAKIPRNIRNHHITVTCWRREGERSL